MDYKNYALDKVIKWILGGELFDFIKELVAGVNDSKISGSDKQAYVFGKVKEFAIDVSTVLINIGIEVAVLLLKAELEKLDVK